MPKPVTPTILDVTTRRGRERAREIWTGIRAANYAPEDIARAAVAGYEPGPDGYFVGRDPREMSQDELLAMGHEPMSPMEAVRRKCLDCCAGSPHEVRLCVAMACPSWPFRMGKNMWRSPISEERRQALSARMRSRLAEPDKIGDPNAGTVLDDESPVDDDPLAEPDKIGGPGDAP